MDTFPSPRLIGVVDVSGRPLPVDQTPLLLSPLDVCLIVGTSVQARELAADALDMGVGIIQVCRSWSRVVSALLRLERIGDVVVWRMPGGLWRALDEHHYTGEDPTLRRVTGRLGDRGAV
jgi:hypothetical protein